MLLRCRTPGFGIYVIPGVYIKCGPKSTYVCILGSYDNAFCNGLDPTFLTMELCDNGFCVCSGREHGKTITRTVDLKVLRTSKHAVELLQRPQPVSGTLWACTWSVRTFRAPIRKAPLMHAKAAFFDYRLRMAILVFGSARIMLVFLEISSPSLIH